MPASSRLCALLIICSLGLAGCSGNGHEPSPSASGSAVVRLKPLSAPLPEATLRHTVYVPVYSSIYTGMDVGKRMIDLGVTLSIRNVSAQHPVVVNFVRYYDSGGTLLREYVNAPAKLDPLASAEFVIKPVDTSGGPGANFLVQWAGQPDVDEPLIETVMVGLGGNVAVSFTSAGRAIRNEPTR